MRGIKEISGLCYWLDNQKAPLLQKVLDNQRRPGKSRQALLRDLATPKPDARSARRSSSPSAPRKN